MVPFRNTLSNTLSCHDWTKVSRHGGIPSFDAFNIPAQSKSNSVFEDMLALSEQSAFNSFLVSLQKTDNHVSLLSAQPLLDSPSFLSRLK